MKAKRPLPKEIEPWRSPITSAVRRSRRSQWMSSAIGEEDDAWQIATAAAFQAFSRGAIPGKEPDASRVVYRWCANALRRESEFATLIRIPRLSASKGPWIGQPTGGLRNPTRSCVKGQEMEPAFSRSAAVREALQSLPRIYRDTLGCLYGFPGYPRLNTRDTARRLGVSVDVVKHRHMRAKKRLRPLLEALDKHNEECSNASDADTSS